VATITIPGGGGGGGVDVEDEGGAINTATTLDFVGAGVDATDAGGGVATITIPGGGGVAIYDVGSFFPGVPANSELLLRFICTRTFTLPAGLTGSEGFLGIAANANTDIDLVKNGVSFGTMRFASAATVATFIAASLTTFVNGDRFDIVGPTLADSTAEDISFTFAGTR